MILQSQAIGGYDTLQQDGVKKTDIVSKCLQKAKLTAVWQLLPWELGPRTSSLSPLSTQ